MAAIRERKKADGSRAYHVQVRQQGFPARTASFPTRRAAERWAKTIEAEMIEGRHFRTAESRRRTLTEAINRYLLEELPKKRDGSMHKFYLPWWRDRLGNLKLADVTPAVIVEYRGKLSREPFMRAKPKSKRSLVKPGDAPNMFPRSPSTVNRYLSVLGHLFTVARKEWHWVSHNPFDAVSKLHEGKGRVRYLNDDERMRLLEETVKVEVLHVMVLIALSTACRAGELLKLTWRDVDLKEERLHFRQTKNAQPRVAWLHGEALRLLKQHAKVRRLDTELVFAASGGGPYDYHTSFTEAVARAGIEDFRFHDLRHSAATYLAMQGASEQQLRAIGGWKSGIVSRYVHLAATDSRAAMQKLADKIDGKESSGDGK